MLFGLAPEIFEYAALPVPVGGVGGEGVGSEYAAFPVPMKGGGGGRVEQ